MGNRAIEEARLLESLQHMTSIGSLADDVVRASLALQRGQTPSGNASLSRAAALLSSAAVQLQAPFDVTAAELDPETLSVLSTMSRFSSADVRSGDDEGGDQPRQRTATRLEHLAAILEKMASAGAGAQQEEIEEVRQQFDEIGRVTLAVANEKVRPRTSVSTWTPIFK
jgi:hypothetical protein